MNVETTMMALMIPIVALTGLLMALTPYLMRRNEVFAVTVPASAQKDARIRRYRRSYALIVALATALLTGAGIACIALGSAGGVLVVVIVGTLVLACGGYVLMLVFRKKVKAYKSEQGWVAQTQETAAVVGEEKLPHAISLAWNLLYLPVMALTFAVSAVGYASMPDVVVTHMSFDGTPNGWMEKSPLLLLMPFFIQAFMAACMVFSHWSIKVSKKWTDPGAPATSALAYGMFARAQSIFLVVSGLLLCGMMVLIPLSFVNAVSLEQAAVGIVVVAIIVTVGAVAVSVVYGQAGSRVFARMQDGDGMVADEDEHWKLGIFYVNRDDAALFLPERFGVGWTINFGRPAAWAIIGGFVAVTVVFIMAMFAITA